MGVFSGHVLDFYQSGDASKDFSAEHLIATDILGGATAHDDVRAKHVCSLKLLLLVLEKDDSTTRRTQSTCSILGNFLRLTFM